MRRINQRILETRSYLTEAQWHALDYLAKQERIIGRYRWLYTCRQCTVTTARILHGYRLLTADEQIKRFKLTPTAHRVLEMGPPEKITMRPGAYLWQKTLFTSSVDV
jgi:hypothetical protein